MFKITLVLFTVTLVDCQFATSFGRVPPRVDGKPNLLDSFIPAGMQIMAHLTELMKYDLKPTVGGISTTTSVPPTPSHKPGIYAPDVPPGPDSYFNNNGLSYQKYVEALQRPAMTNYFWYRQKRNIIGPDVYFGRKFASLLNLVNRFDDLNIKRSVDEQVQEFSQNYDDSDVRYILLRKKQVPPTKAYVTLLSLYDSLNKESKKIGLNKYQGYTDAILQQLVESSTGTSAYQLRYVLNKIVERQDTKRADLLNKIKKLVTDLDQDNSYINDALRYIPPLPFIL